MSILKVTRPYPFYFDQDGSPLDNGYVYIGVEDTDPIENPIEVYWDEDMCCAAPQPIRTLNGFAVNNGIQANLYVNSSYSIRVEDKAHVLISYIQNGWSTEGLGAANIANGVANSVGYQTADEIRALPVPTAPNLKVELYGPQGGVFVADLSDTTTPENGVNGSAGTVIVSVLGVRYFRQYDGDVYIKWFGSDISSLKAAGNHAISSDSDSVTVNGQGVTFPAAGKVSFSFATTKHLKLKDIALKSTGVGLDELGLDIVALSATITLDSVTYDGQRDQKYIGETKEQWHGISSASSGGDTGTTSVWPGNDTSSLFAVKVNCKELNIFSCKLTNTHSLGYYLIQDGMVVNVKDFYAENTSFTSMYVGSKFFTMHNYRAVDCGKMASSFDVLSGSATGSSVTQDDGFRAQGSFGARINADNIIVDGVHVENFYTTALVVDTESDSTVTNVTIENNENTNRPNQFTAGIFYELTPNSTLSNYQFKLNDRNIQGRVSGGLYIYVGNSSVVLSNINMTHDVASDVPFINVWDNGDSLLTMVGSSFKCFNDSGSASIYGVLNYPLQQPGKVNISGLSSEGAVKVDFRDYKELSIDSANGDNLAVWGGNYQASFENSIKISNTSFVEGYFIGAENLTIENSSLVGELQLYGGLNVDSQTRVSNSLLDLGSSAASLYGGGGKSTVKINDCEIIKPSGSLNIRDAGLVSFINNVVKFNSAVNAVNVQIGVDVFNYRGNTFLKGPAGVPAGMGLGTYTVINNIGNVTNTYDWVDA